MIEPILPIELKEDMPKFSESQLVSAIMKRCWLERSWLTIDRANSGARAFTDHNGRKGYYRGHRAGWADLVGFISPHGRFIAIEAKLPGNKQQLSQMEFEIDVKGKGGLYYLIHSLDELEAMLKEIKEPSHVSICSF